jgi:hypothetical protein
VASAEDLVDKLSELVDALVGSPMVAGFCYTQLTDTEQEDNGLLTADRQPKAPLEHIRAALSRPARSDPASEVDETRADAAGPTDA